MTVQATCFSWKGGRETLLNRHSIGMETMKREQLDLFKEMLAQQLQTLLYQGGDTVTGIRNQEHVYSDPLDRAAVDEEQSRMLRIRDRESYLIKKVRQALKRIEEGNFGVCEACGEMISHKRLLARPVTTKCITCKTAEERLEKAAGL